MGKLLRTATLAGLVATFAQAGVVQDNYAQRLIDRLLRRHPEVAAAAMHVAPPGESSVRIIAAGGEGGGREMLLPLRQADGRTVGDLGLVFRPSAGRAGTDLAETAAGLRDSLQPVIPSRESLFEPFITGYAPEDALAQKLVMRSLERHREVLVVAMHITPPGGRTNKVVAINEPRFIGRDSDEVDTDTEKTGKVVMQVIPRTHRMEVHMPLLSAAGARVGTICTVFLWQDETQAADFFVRSLALRDELAPEIPCYEALFKP